MDRLTVRPDMTIVVDKQNQRQLPILERIRGVVIVEHSSLLIQTESSLVSFEPRHEKTCPRGFRQGNTQTGQLS